LDENENAFGFLQLMQKCDIPARTSWPGMKPFLMAGRPGHPRLCLFVK